MILESHETILRLIECAKQSFVVNPMRLTQAKLAIQKSQEQLDIHNEALEMFRTEPERIERDLVERVKQAEFTLNANIETLKLYELSDDATRSQLADLERWLVEHPEDNS